MQGEGKEKYAGKGTDKRRWSRRWQRYAKHFTEEQRHGIEQQREAKARKGAGKQRRSMSNNGRYTLCPYYRDEKNKSISCEDTFRTFRWKSQKKEWMDQYCDKDWCACPYAQSLTDMYEAIEKGDVMAEENHKIEALQKEIKNLASKLGRAEKRLEPKEEEIKQLRKKNHKLEGMYFEEHRKLLNAQKESDELKAKFLDKAAAELNQCTRIYEDRMCYMIEKLGGKLYEKDMDAWSKDKEFALTFELEGDDRVWKVVQREVQKKQVRKQEDND